MTKRDDELTRRPFLSQFCIRGDTGRLCSYDHLRLQVTGNAGFRLRLAGKMAADTVIGVFERDLLPAALAAVHRAGYGPNARVLQGERGSMTAQLKRVGISKPPPLDADSRPVLVLFAPARVAHAVDLLQRSGASAVHVASRDQNGAPYAPSGWTPPTKPARVQTPKPSSATSADDSSEDRVSH